MSERCFSCKKAVPEEVLDRIDDISRGDELICCVKCNDKRMKVVAKVGKFMLVKWIDEVEPVE